MRTHGKLITAAIMLTLLAGVWTLTVSRRGSVERSTGQAATDTPKATIEYLQDSAYPPTNDGWAPPVTANARPTYRALSASDLAEQYRFATQVECTCHVTLEEVREYGSNDAAFLGSFLSPQRIADLPNSGSVVLIIVHRIDDGSTKPYQAVLTHRDKGGLIVMEASSLAQLTGRFPTPVP